MVGAQATNASSPVSSRSVDGEGAAQVDGEVKPPTHNSHIDARASSTAADKYFIVKSLTLQDLELSVRNGIWATQSHNEEALNKAFDVRACTVNMSSNLLTQDRLPTTSTWYFLRTNPVNILGMPAWHPAFSRTTASS